MLIRPSKVHELMLEVRYPADFEQQRPTSRCEL